MQVITGYQDHAVSPRHELRLYHATRPKIRAWRRSQVRLDAVDRLILDTIKDQPAWAVDFAGWYLETWGAQIQCLESSDLSRRYWPQCRVEPDLACHRPSYVETTQWSVFKQPSWLRYMTLEQFVIFLQVWSTGPMLLNFEPVLIQHNHLKHDLLTLVEPRVPARVQRLHRTVWSLTP